MRDLDTFTGLTLDVVERVAIVTLNRPEQRNAWTVRLAAELDEMLRHLDSDAGIAVVVVTGAGTAFSVGADLASGSIDSPGDNPGDEDVVLERPLLPSGMSKPVVAAINGHAVGAGITFSLHCDVRVISRAAKVGFPFVRRGVVAEMGAHWMLPRLVGVGVATDVLLTGRIFSAAEALTMGLVHRVVEPDEVLTTAIDIASEMARDCSPMALSSSKALLWDSMSLSWEVASGRERDVFRTCAAHPDAAEGVASFLEKRPPRWCERREAK